MRTNSLFDGTVDTSADSPAPLCEKYRPLKISDFVGLEKPKQLLQKFAGEPYGCAWLFVGRSGTGKTAMARALASAISAKIHFMPAKQCTRENVARLWATCQNDPGRGYQRHLILVDQAERLSKPHQSDLRSKLEGNNLRPNIVWVFTALDSDGLDDGFRSRCLEIKFSSYGIAKDAAALLELIWEAEKPAADITKPNFARIIKEANNNLRAALREIELKLGTSDLERNQESRASVKTAIVSIHRAEMHSGDTILKTYLEGKPVTPEEARVLYVFCKQQQKTWNNIVADVKILLEK
jgi:replication-associated recombination protein RarA